MQLSIHDFLQKLAAEAKVLPQIREMLRQEIEKYTGMRMVLSNTEKSKDFTAGLLTNIDNYLKNLKLVEQKFRYTFYALIPANPQEDPEINRQVLQILKKLNCKEQ